MGDPFARTSPEKERSQKELDAQRFDELRASLSRLVANEDFRSWFQYVNWNLYGEAVPTTEIDASTQGKRAVMGFLKRSLSIADGGPEFLGELTRKHFTAVAQAKARSRLGKETGENS